MFTKRPQCLIKMVMMGSQKQLAFFQITELSIPELLNSMAKNRKRKGFVHQSKDVTTS